MLKGISPCLSPDLLKTLAEMGHGDALLLADAHFPGHTLGQRTLRADGLSISTLLAGILPLFELDHPANALIMMQPSTGNSLDPAVERDFVDVARRFAPQTPTPLRLERLAFYERARTCYAIVITGELRPYGNLLLVKGVNTIP